MITDSPMNIPDIDKDTEVGELFVDGLIVELWVEVGPVVDEGVVLVADGMLEDELAVVGPAALY
jgi:hypothetical protein